MGWRSLQCAVTRTMARGAASVPSLRISGTRVRSERTISVCEGSSMSGMGPPPWERAMTAARGISADKAEEFVMNRKGCWFKGAKMSAAELRAAMGSRRVAVFQMRRATMAQGGGAATWSRDLIPRKTAVVAFQRARSCTRGYRRCRQAESGRGERPSDDQATARTPSGGFPRSSHQNHQSCVAAWYYFALL